MVALNELSPGAGAKPVGKRVGRGIGSGLGKTCGKGHKGQKSRSGASISPGFEGGQMPLYRRLPKSGFNSRKKLYTAKIRLEALNKVAGDVVTLDTLKEAGLINKHIKQVKVFLAGKITRPVQVSGIVVTSGARAAIEAAGGKVEG